MSQLETSGYEVLAATCHDDHCPTRYRDPVTGRIGVRGYLDGGETGGREAIVWMDPAQWEMLRGGA